jgi:hypothetical protein
VVDGVVSLITELGLNWVEGRARGKEDSTLGPLNSLLECALGLGERVAEREKDGAAFKATLLDRALESTDNGLSEDAKGGGETNESAGLDILNDLLESTELMAIVINSGEVLLVLSQTVTTVPGDKTLGINKPKLLTGGGLAQATASVVLNELLSDTDTSRASTHEDKTLILERNTGLLNSTNVSTQDDSTSALDIIVLLTTC